MKKTLFWSVGLLALGLMGAPGQSNAFDVLGAIAGSGSQRAIPTNQSQIEVAFSPEDHSLDLVIKVIKSAKKDIRLSAYSFTLPEVVSALIEAKKKSVNVAVIVDHKSNISDDHSGKSKAALNLLVNAGIPLRTVASYQILHDKYIVVDSMHVETGSFNYSRAAVTRNSENVIVIWNSPQVAAMYLKHWASRYDQGLAYVSAY